ncbi:MAG: helix-turn-helix domain-containing protein [Actinomyces sp.]|uniref:helix-turn-helix domain-containing protein n=1 Tax=Actinomyces sp. TaxID=29317 RepID=UPI0026DB148E|nr:helix-turn-helix domain-containing protein [Actinomyces sp.]MDO4243770.1 helix-turn-helix domain-containing protein [Actinomyces sp.]
MSSQGRELARLVRAVEALADRVERLEGLLVSGAVEAPRTLSVDEVVRLTGAPRRMVLAAIRTGDLPAVEVGERTRLVRPQDLDMWLERLERRSVDAA